MIEKVFVLTLWKFVDNGLDRRRCYRLYRQISVFFFYRNIWYLRKQIFFSRAKVELLGISPLVHLLGVQRHGQVCDFSILNYSGANL